MTRRINLAVVGVSGAVGEALLAALEERAFPLAELFLLDEGACAGETVRHGGKSIQVQPVEQFDFTRAELAFFCGDAALSHANATVAAESGCLVIDCSDAFRDEPEVPLVIPEVNQEALDGFRARNIIASPSANTIFLLTVIKPLYDAAGIMRADVVSYEAVSECGKAGVDELSGQVVSLLNMRDTSHSVFPQRIAFNVIPQVGGLLDNGYSEGEMKMVTEAQKILGDPGINLNPTAVQVPVFYGHSLAVHLQTEASLTADEARVILGETPGVELMEGKVPTPALDAANHDAIYVGRLREGLGHGGGLNLWITSDNSRKGAALNALQIAEIVEKCYM
jgi:aspartate-semialdehyde dehydrogenase